ncbi:VacJ family lipoprotein [Sphingobium aromaticiconvertens]|uniref:MlaA family lipoprotein n=1 Tax=Sphingobium aromaticiconvertens TaxID=365341 RepID=UPI00301A8A57
MTAGDRSTRVDPFESVNVQAFDAVQSVDKAVTGPVAMKYKKSVPGPVRSGVRNFLSNLQEPVIFLNYLLQLKPGKAAETAGRFGINSTLGFVGLFDTAKKKPFHLPRRNNGFGYTLGYYGVKPGPYLYLPLIGPTTLRDVTGRLVDLSVLPYAVGTPFSEPLYAIPTTTVRLLDERAEADDDIQTLRDGDEDPYTAGKKNYLRTRQAEIDALHGKRKTPE